MTDECPNPVREFILEHGLDALVDRTHVKVKQNKLDLTLLEYDQLNSPMGDPLTQGCRGLILDHNNAWRVVSWSFDKFFNAHEGHAAPVRWDNARVYEKLDGSLMTLFFHNDTWHVATKGTADASGPMPLDRTRTFSTTFWEAFNASGYELPEDTTRSYTFELMSPWNQVVVRQHEMRLVLIGARSLVTGQEEDPEDVSAECGFECVRTFAFKDRESVLKEAMEMNGLKQEGFVVCDMDFNRIKIKAKQYVALHHMKYTSGASLGNLLAVVQAGEIAEFVSYFPEYEARAQELSEKFESIIKESEALYEEVKDIEVQKEFALKVKDKPWCGVFFQMRAGRVDSIETWFRAHDSKRMLKYMGMDPTETV
jgi:hypothetical protein